MNTKLISAIIVTYLDRGEMCVKVAKRLLSSGIRDIIIIDNASSTHSARLIDDLSEKNSSIHIIRNSENIGPGAAISQGLKHSEGLNNDFILILDDDNYPKEDCIKKLISAHELLGGDDVLLYANRGSTRSGDLGVLSGVMQKNYIHNAFCGHSLTSSFRKILSFHGTYGNDINTFRPIVAVNYGPYGGMFSGRNTFSKIGYPREDYFVYADDHEYSLRMHNLGIKQYIVESAKIDDLDISFEPNHGYMSFKSSEMRTYYQIRNHTHLSKAFITNNFFYKINKISFLVKELVKARRILFSNPRASLERWRLVRKSIRDGESGKLGRVM